MRKVLISLIILTMTATVFLVAWNIFATTNSVSTEKSTQSTATTESVFAATETAVAVATASDSSAVTEAAAEPVTFTISMNFVGDIMLAGNETATADIDALADSQPETYFFENVRDYFLNDDLTIANCENVFTDNDSLAKRDKGQTTAQEEYENALAEYNSAVALAEQSGTTVSMEKPEYTFRAFWFRAKTEHAKLLSANGVDIVSIDNNHTYDFGQEGNTDTRAALDAAGVAWGKDGKIVYKEINGFTIAFVFGSMYAAGEERAMLVDLEEAKQNSDYQIVYFHGGEEKVHAYEEWKQNSCHNLVDNGADLIIGAHPHVLQPMETYNGANIVYSLGNFVFGGNSYPENRTIIYNQTLTISQDPQTGAFTVTDTNVTITPCYVYTGSSNNYQPAVITDEAEKQAVLDFMEGKRELPY